MTASPRHMACRTCRERKVRCDGGQPSCETCKRHGEKCVYMQAARQTKNHLLAKIDNLQERLARAEAQLSSSSSVSSPPPSCCSVPFAPVTPLSSNEATPSNPATASKLRSSVSMPENRMGQTAGGNTPITCSDGVTGPLDPFTSAMGPGTMDDPTLSLPWPLSFQSLPDEPWLSDPGATSSDSTSQDNHPPIPSLPTLRALRVLNEQRLAQEQHQVRDVGPGDGCAGLQEVMHFVSATFTNQSHIAGMTNAVAEYLSWARRNPDVNFAKILEILEMRLRETSDLAGTQHWVEFQKLQASLGNEDAYKWKMGWLEQELQAVEADILTFFSTSYDIRSALSIQRNS